MHACMPNVVAMQPANTYYMVFRSVDAAAEFTCNLELRFVFLLEPRCVPKHRRIISQINNE